MGLKGFGFRGLGFRGFRGFRGLGFEGLGFCSTCKPHFVVALYGLLMVSESRRSFFEVQARDTLSPGLLNSSCLGLSSRILNFNHKKEVL